MLAAVIDTYLGYIGCLRGRINQHCYRSHNRILLKLPPQNRIVA